MAHRRKKKRTHVREAAESGAIPTPKSFVVGRFASKSINQAAPKSLVRDLRRMMEPNTASKLKERKGNKIKDFVSIAGHFGVTHLMLLSSSSSNLNLRIARIPRGPTISFRINEYVLSKDLRSLQQRPKSPGSDFKCSPLVVLNNFTSSENHIKLMSTLFQNLFPAINVQTIKLANTRRVVLFNLDHETNSIQLRHYSIDVKTTGVSKSVKNLLQTKIPDLTNFTDVSDYILREAFASESDVEDAGESTIILSQKYAGRGNAPKSNDQRSVKLVELGPRVTMSLIKIQEGLCDGNVMYHSYIEKTEEEIRANAAKIAALEKLKEERKAEQDANIAKKKSILASVDGAPKRKRLSTEEALEEEDSDDEEFSDGNEESEEEAEASEAEISE